MTTNQPDRLDRMEALLERFISASIADARESNERMSRLEQTMASDRQASNERLTRMEQLAESNSRSIQALSDDLMEHRLTTAEERAELREAIQRLTTLNEGVVNLLSSLDEDRPTILRKLSTIENKVDRLLERRNGDQPQP